MNARMRLAVLGGLILIASVPRGARGDNIYVQTNLITSATDPDLINPWGISSGGSGPFWVSDNATGKSTLYNSAGVKQGLVVSMPVGSEPITGQVFNGTASFNGDVFLFASENGTISGWRGGLGMNAEQLASVTNAVYKGLAISDTKDTLFAANFRTGAIDVFSGPNAPPSGSFSDPNAPVGYAPFNIQNIGGKFYVTFTQQNGLMHDDVSGVGHGFIDTFDPITHTFTRLATGSAAGGTVDALNSPWGLALAPITFGGFGGDLLVGNFGDGRINAFDPTTGAFLGHLNDANGNAIVNPGLWGLKFGNNGKGGDSQSLYFAAGGANESSGVFGRIRSVPEPGSFAMLGLGGCLAWTAFRRHRGRAGARS